MRLANISGLDVASMTVLPFCRACASNSLIPGYNLFSRMPLTVYLSLYLATAIVACSSVKL